MADHEHRAYGAKVWGQSWQKWHVEMRISSNDSGASFCIFIVNKYTAWRRKYTLTQK